MDYHMNSTGNKNLGQALVATAFNVVPTLAYEDATLATNIWDVEDSQQASP